MSDTPQDPDKPEVLPVPATGGNDAGPPPPAPEPSKKEPPKEESSANVSPEKEGSGKEGPGKEGSGKQNPGKRGSTGAAGGKAGPSKPRATRPRGTLTWSALFSLLLLAGLLVLGFYTWEQQKADDVLFREYSRLVTVGSDLEQRLDQSESSQSAGVRQLQQALDESREQLEQQNSRLEDMNRELVALRLRVSRQSGSADQAWMLTEAESLLRLAQQRLLHARDVTTAQSLFLSSDDVLRQIDDPSIQAVRELLLADLDALRGVRVPDIQTMYTQLGELREQLGQLRLNAEAQARELSFQAPELAADQDQGWFDELKSSLGQYFVITRQDNPVVPQLSTEQVLMTRQILNLYLEQARVALLQGQTRVYQEALDQVASVTRDYMQGSGKDAILARLEQLRNAPILPMIPPVGSALNALRQISPGLSGTGEPQQ